MSEHIINIPCSAMPMLLETNSEIAPIPFIHCNRIADFHVLIYLKAGCMEVIEDGTVYKLLPNSSFFLKGGIHHVGVTPCDKGTAWDFAHFVCSEITSDMVEYDWQTVVKGRIRLSQEDLNKYFSIPKITTLPQSSDIKRLLSDMINAHNTGNTLGANNLLWQVLFEISELPHRNKTISKSKVSDVISFIEKHYCDNFSSKDVEKYIGFSYKYISSIFKTETGMTIKEYQLMLRIRQAAKLLCSTDLDIAEISDKIGFYDPFYFSRIFKREKGFSPSKYRQNYILEYNATFQKSEYYTYIFEYNLFLFMLQKDYTTYINRIMLEDIPNGK